MERVTFAHQETLECSNERGNFWYAETTKAPEGRPKSLYSIHCIGFGSSIYSNTNIAKGNLGFWEIVRLIQLTNYIGVQSIQLVANEFIAYIDASFMQKVFNIPQW